jgi:hypothetical protein
MNNLMDLPKKIKVSVICELIGLSGMSQEAKLDALISFSQDSGLLFTFHEKVKAMPAEISIGDIYDDKGEFIEFRPAKDEDIQYIETAKSFKLMNYNINKGKPFTYISSFKEGGVAFNIINNDNSDIGVFDIDLAHVYVKESDYINFTTRLKTPSPKIKAPYQDVNSEYYSPELDLAIQLHHAIHIDKFGKVGLKRERKVTKWLNENKPNEDLSDAKIKRLSTIIGLVEKTG